MIKQILTADEVKEAIYVDADFSTDQANALSQSVTSYIKQITGYDWSADKEIEPLAKQCAKMLCLQFYYNNGENYKPEYDMHVGATALLEHLKDIARSKKK